MGGVTACGTGQTVSATFRYDGEVGTQFTPPIIRSTYNCNYSIWHWSNRLCYLPLLWSRDGVTSARCCNYNYMWSWWWVELPPETCRAVYRKYNKLYIVASCWTIIDNLNWIVLGAQLGLVCYVWYTWDVGSSATCRKCEATVVRNLCSWWWDSEGRNM